MTEQELAEFHRTVCEEARELLIRKNRDYANAREGDVFSNLDACERLGLCSTEEGILIRVTDKLRRLISLVDRDPSDRLSESVEDTQIDIINYVVLMAAKQRSRKGGGGTA